MESLAAHFLIASPKLVESNFAKSVVLIVQHGEEGALGLIVNRPLETTVAQVCEKVLEVACEADGVLYQGGPCEGPLMVVHTDEVRSDVRVKAGVHFTTDRQHIEWLLAHDEGPVKYFVGYAGWAAGQLESELETGSWLTLPAENEHIFNAGPGLWSRLLSTATLSKWIDPSRIPDDPTVN
jgi:putative transcriptional regulator